MNELHRIADQLRRAWNGDSWHGPSLGVLLEGVTAAQAAAHPIPDAHSIWELVLHITVWQDVARQRLEGVAVHPEGEADWPPVAETGESAWEAARARLAASTEALCQTIVQQAPEQLEKLMPGTTTTGYVLLHGVVQHNLYHAGQIALLRKYGRTR